MRGKSEVIAVQMFTAREEIPFLEGIPTPNSNYPRTGKGEEKDDKDRCDGKDFRSFATEMLDCSVSFRPIGTRIA